MAFSPEMGRTFTYAAPARWRSSGMVSWVSRAAASRAAGNRQSPGSSLSLKKYRLYRSLSSGRRASGGSMFSDGIIVRVRAAACSWPAISRSTWVIPRPGLVVLPSGVCAARPGAVMLPAR